MREITKNEIVERLRLDNPWWRGAPNIRSEIGNWPRRDYFAPFFQLVSDRDVNRAVVLMGPRRVGKTVMAHHAIQALLNLGKKHILYVSLETPTYSGLTLEELVRLYRRQFDLGREEEAYFFFDEIQYHRNWEVHLKSLVDTFPSYRFTVTGSAAAALRLKSNESGAGRFSDFLLPPLSFTEFLRFRDLEDVLIRENDSKEDPSNYQAIDIERLNEAFTDYINYGGYPEAVFSETIQRKSEQYIKNDIIDKVLLRDLPSLYGITDIQELNRLFGVLAYNTSHEISIESLSKTSHVAKNTLRRYLEYLEAAFLIKRLYRIDDNARRFKRVGTFKVYLTNPTLRCALFGSVDMDSLEMGAMTETAIFGQWLHGSLFPKIHYARWKKGEIDMVFLDRAALKPEALIEIKWSDKAWSNPQLLRHVFHFMDLHPNLPMPVVTTRTRQGIHKVGERFIWFIPNSVYAYMLGKNLFENGLTRIPGNHRQGGRL